MFSFKLFGGACLEGDDGPVKGPAAQRHRLALLALLATAHPGGISRDKLLVHLWPERDAAHARNLLKQAVHALRRALGEEAIRSAGEELRLDLRAVRCDMIAFEEALAAGALEQAVTLYSGPFLDGFFLSEAPAFERWLDGERERFARSHAKALERLAEAAAARGDGEAAVAWWRRLATEDPYNARVALCLMQALEAAGDRVGAIQHARLHGLLLEQELGAQPDPEVTALAERLRCAPPGDPGSRAERREPQTGVTSSPPADGDPPDIPTSPPTAAPPLRRAIPWRTAALAGSALLAILSLLSLGGLLPDERPGQAAAPEPRAAGIRTLAVLPFTNLDRDPEEDYISDGLTEELIGALSRVGALRVAARTSAFVFKGESRDIREIGRALDVEFVLEGSVRTQGDRVRVAAQLISAADGFPLWSATYERRLTDIFAIQSDLALQIASALATELTPAERARLEHRPTENLEAYALYLKGRYFWNQRTGAGYARAIEYFQRAIAADPTFAAAYAGLGSVYSMQGFSGELSAAEAGERSRDAALMALALDAELAEAHTVLGGYYHVYAWDSDAAERAHRRALALNPGYATAHHWYGNFLTSVGRHEEAISHKQTAVELDPLTPVLSESLGYSYVLVGRTEAAFAALRSAIELDSTYWRAYSVLGNVYEATGQLEEALRAYQRAAALGGVNANTRVGQARVLALLGRQPEARRLLDGLQAEAERRGSHNPNVATVLLALGDAEGALAWLERSYAERHPQLRLTAFDQPRYALLQDDPRFRDLVRRVGLRP